MEQIKLDMIPKGITPIAHASQYDQGRLIHFILMDNLQAFILTDETVTIKVCKPDNNIVTEEATYTANTNIVTISTTDQMCAVAGDAKCELSVSKGDVKIGSLNFILRVEEDPLKDGVESETVIANLDTIIDNAVSEALNDTVLYGAYPTAEIDNVPIASFSDGADDVPVKALQIGIEATQEGTGTPSPDNIRPIIGFTGANIVDCGKNLFDKSTATTGKFYNAQGQEVVNVNKAHSVLLKIKPSTTYYMSGYGGAGFYAILAYDENLQPIDNWYGGASKTAPFTATTPANARYCYLNFDLDLLDTVMFCEADTAQPYEAYNGTTYPISWQDEAGIVYGAKSKPIVGGLTVTCTGVLIDGVTVKATSGDLYSGRLRASIPYPSGKTAHYEGATTYCLCDKIEPNYNATIGSQVGSDILAIFPHSSGIFIKFSDDCNVSDVESANAWLSNNNVFVVYELSTPVTYQLDPVTVKSILGDNNIFADTGDIQNLIYRRDMNSIVEAIPAPPSENGTYSLKCTVSGGIASYSWVAD